MTAGSLTQEELVQGIGVAHAPVGRLYPGVHQQGGNAQQAAEEAAGGGDDAVCQLATPQAQQHRDCGRRVQQVRQQEQADHIVVLQASRKSLISVLDIRNKKVLTFVIRQRNMPLAAYCNPVCTRAS